MRGKHQDYDQNYDQTYDQNYDQKYYQKYKKYKTLYKQARRRQVDGRQAYGGAKDDLGGLGDLGSLDDSGNAGASGSGGDDLGGLGGLGDDGDSAGAGKTNPIGVQMGAPAPQKPVVNKEDLDALEKDTVQQLNSYVKHYNRYETQLRGCMEKCKMRLPVCITDNVKDLSDGYHTLQRLYHEKMGDLNLVDYDNNVSSDKKKK
jgi:hypothetical protein